jgi:predicted DCC family thiol-disulfide oxidoreductase YuxK
MERIHAILPDGTIVRDVEVFRRLYEAVGLGWVYAITKNPSVLNAANSVYGVWAKYRTQITGREALEVILQRHNAGAAAGSLCRNSDGSISSDGACELPSAAGEAPKNA